LYLGFLKEFRGDEITRQFVELENSVFMKNSENANSGNHLLVLESNDSLKYFAVKTIHAKECYDEGGYTNLGDSADQGRMVRFREGTRINLDKSRKL